MAFLFYRLNDCARESVYCIATLPCHIMRGPLGNSNRNSFPAPRSISTKDPRSNPARAHSPFRVAMHKLIATANAPVARARSDIA